MITPPTIISLLCRSGAYIVGGYADYLIGNAATFNDHDLIVPPDKWYLVSLLIPKNATINSYGGWKFRVRGAIQVDIWPSSIEQYLRQYKGQHKKACVLDHTNNKIFTIEEVE